MHLPTSTYRETMFTPATSTPTPVAEHGACFLCTFISNTILMAHFIFLVSLAFLMFAFMGPFSASRRSKRAFRFERNLSFGWFIWLQCLIAHATFQYYTDPWADVMGNWRGMVWRQKSVQLISLRINGVHIVGFIVEVGTFSWLWWRIVGKKEQEREQRVAQERRERSDIGEMWRDYIASTKLDGEKGRV